MKNCRVHPTHWLISNRQNQMDQSEDRATAWVEQLKAEGMPL